MEHGIAALQAARSMSPRALPRSRGRKTVARWAKCGGLFFEQKETPELTVECNMRLVDTATDVDRYKGGQGTASRVFSAYGEVPTRILTLEYLMANMLRLHRPKDRAKLALIAESHRNTFDAKALKNILERHGLWEKWNRGYEADPGP